MNLLDSKGNMKCTCRIFILWNVKSLVFREYDIWKCSACYWKHEISVKLRKKVSYEKYEFHHFTADTSYRKKSKDTSWWSVRREVSKLGNMNQIWPDACFENKILLEHSNIHLLFVMIKILTIKAFKKSCQPQM